MNGEPPPSFNVYFPLNQYVGTLGQVHEFFPCASSRSCYFDPLLWRDMINASLFQSRILTWQTYFFKQVCRMLLVDHVEYTPHEQKQPKDAATKTTKLLPSPARWPSTWNRKAGPITLQVISAGEAMLVLEVPSTYGQFFSLNTIHATQMNGSGREFSSSLELHCWYIVYRLKLRVCRQKSPLLLSCWKRTWLHFQSHPSSAQMEIDEELRSWEIVLRTHIKSFLSSLFQKFTQSHWNPRCLWGRTSWKNWQGWHTMQFLGFKTRTKRSSEYRVFRGDHHEWSNQYTSSTQQVPIFPNLERIFCGQKNHWVPPQVCRITQELQRSK